MEAAKMKEIVQVLFLSIPFELTLSMKEWVLSNAHYSLQMK